MDIPAGVTQEEGHTGFLIHLPSAVRALIFVLLYNCMLLQANKQTQSLVWLQRVVCTVPSLMAESYKRPSAAGT